MNDIQTKIINKYKKISGFIFHYLIFFVALIIALFIFQRVISQSATINVFQTNDNLLIQKTRLIAEFNKFLKQDVKNNDLVIYVLQGDFQTEQGFIKSVSNLISYKWFVVPKYFYMYNTLPVKPMSYFSGGKYDTSELENFVNIFVFTKKISVNKPFTRVQLPLSKTLMEDFNLGCISESKISSITCNHYLNNFLDSFFVYTLALDYPGLKNIFDAIKNNANQKERFCGWLSKYLLYANDQNDAIKELFGLCGQDYEDLFKRTATFMEIQKTLENQTFEKISYKDTLLNAYKLLSYQQQIYQDFLINRTDTYKIASYLDFVRELSKNNTIEPFYTDEIYRYNNKYLSLTLEKIAYQSSVSQQNIWGNKIASLLTTITTLNEWEPMLGFSGLNTEIQNKTLIVEQEANTWVNITISLAEKIQKKLQSISYLTIEKQTISDTTIDIVGYLKFFSPDKNETIKTHIIMDYKNDMLLVQSIDLQNKPEINDVIKNLLLIQNFSIGELYSYISKNLVFYGQTNAPINAATDLCPWLKTIQNITLVTCTNTGVTIDQNTIRYEFALNNGGVANITLSDKTLENLIKTSYSTIIWNSYSLLDTIQAILMYKATTQVHQGTTNAIVVFEKIQHYLWIKANDIADNNWTILVDITLGWINFIVNYTLSTNTLGPWYFKDIRINNKPYLIQNLNLPLDDAHQNSINSFVIDPLTAIKKADLTARQNYNAF
ncbi:MAG: hypothetical protein ACD_80C00162G0001, partial [uncultured bacterium (gcode 4)]